MNIFKTIALFFEGFSEGWQETREEQQKMIDEAKASGSLIDNAKIECNFAYPVNENYPLNELEAQINLYSPSSD